MDGHREAGAEDISFRHRNSRVNGADIYVARVTKSGLTMGNAKPCWRCLRWCHWAGIKRIFHWDPLTGGWEVVKVNSPGMDQYETIADIRLGAEAVCDMSIYLPSADDP